MHRQVEYRHLLAIAGAGPVVGGTGPETRGIAPGYITLFWACTPHQLTRPGDCQQMAIFNLPMHLFLSWPLDRELINHVTHGMVIKSLASRARQRH